ncbi:MAG TPA: class I SAM-dependent methyltransferase [Actinomycetes bacterium]
MSDRERFENSRFAQAYLRVGEKADRRGVVEHRRRLLAGLAGAVCEVGAGQGLNFAHYPPTVTHVLAVEPEPTLRRHATALAARARVPVDVVAGSADRLPMPDGSCDAVVASLVLCSVPNQSDALAEAWRVLRPGGELRFYEHVRSRHAAVAWLEDLATPLWSRMAGGCHPNRDTVAAIRDAGFDQVVVDRFGFAPHPILPPAAHVLGRAERP